MAGASAFAVAALLGGRAWWVASRHPWLDPRTVQAQAIALGALALAWIGVRLAARERPGARALLEPAGPTVERGLVGAVLLALVGLAC
jgi:hypothetical protein